MIQAIDDNFLSRLRETQTVEVKKSLAQKKEGLKALNGMVNSDVGIGYVIFGIEPNGTVCGLSEANLDMVQRDLVEHIRAKVDPPLVVTMEIWQYSDKHLLAVSAQRSRETPFHEYDGRAFIRQGSTTRQLTLDEKNAFARRRNRDMHQGPWRCDKCGANVGMLVSMEYDGRTFRRTYRCDCGGEYWPVA